MSLCNYRPTDVNILVVGEIGTGKSTFINALANYLSFRDFYLALKVRRPIILAPAEYTVADKMNTRYTVTAGKVRKSFDISGTRIKLGTQDLKTYAFQVWNGLVTIRIIDTPGLEKDNKNVDKIMDYIAKRFEIHAVCFVLKPLLDKLSKSILTFMSSLILNLSPKIVDNFMFAFTHTRQSFYSMGHSKGIMQKAFQLLESRFRGVKIPFEDNIFCFENEPFVQLVTNKNYIILKDEVRQLNAESWTISCSEAWKFIHYIVGSYASPPLRPFVMVEKSSINDARRVLDILTQPMVDIAQYLIVNIALLLSHRDKLASDKLDVKEVRSLFKVPRIKMKIDSTVYPVVLCASLECVSKIQVDDVHILFPKTICKSPNDLSDNKRQIIGDEELIKCRVFDGNTRKCIKCDCAANYHMYSYYLNEFYRKDASFSYKIENISSTKTIEEEVDNLIQQIDEKILDFREELRTIAISTARFRFFLKTTSVKEFNDTFRDYIKFLIAREEMHNIKENSEILIHLRKTLEIYDMVLLDHEKNNVYKPKYLRTVDECKDLLGHVNVVISKVFGLKICGHYLNKFYNTEVISRKNEYRSTIHYMKNDVETQKVLQKAPSETMFMGHSNTTDDYWKSWSYSPTPYLTYNTENKHDYVTQLLNLSISEQKYGPTSSPVNFCPSIEKVCPGNVQYDKITPLKAG